MSTTFDRPLREDASGTHRRRHSAGSHLREVTLLSSLYILYCLVRVVGGDDLVRAQERAGRLVEVEAALHIDIEFWLNSAIADVAWLAVPMDYWYAVLHYAVTPAALAWLYWRHRSAYVRGRNAIVVASTLGLLGYLLFPTAPPRLMGGRYSDTLAKYAHVGWWSEHASAPSGLGGLTNELAAMPSLHVGWAVWVAWALYQHASSRGRRLLLLSYPVVTTAVVIGTANHWLLDCVLGLVVTVVGIVVATVHHQRGDTRHITRGCGCSRPRHERSPRSLG